MMIRASDLQEGQRIHIEYGAACNWVSLTIEKIYRVQNMVMVVSHFGPIKADVSFRPDEEVEVLQGDAGHV